MLEKKLDMDMLRKMDVDGGGVSEMEFLIFMLVQVMMTMRNVLSKVIRSGDKK